MSFLDELQETIGSVRDRVGPSVVGLGRGWGRGSGVVIAEHRVLTNAHVLRGDAVAVARGDEVVQGRVAGADPDLDIAIVEADTGGVPPVTWDPAREVCARPARVRARRPRRPRPARVVRRRDGHRAIVPRAARPPHRRLDRALGAAAARVLRRAARRRRRPAARHQHRAHGGRAAARAPRGRGAARARDRAGPRRGAGASAARARDRAAARGAPAPRRGRAPAARRAARARRGGGRARRGRAGLERGDLLVAAGGRPLGGVDDLFDALAASDGELELVAVRGTEERTVVAHFN